MPFGGLFFNQFGVVVDIALDLEKMGRIHVAPVRGVETTCGFVPFDYDLKGPISAVNTPVASTDDVALVNLGTVHVFEARVLADGGGDNLRVGGPHFPRERQDKTPFASADQRTVQPCTGLLRLPSKFYVSHNLVILIIFVITNVMTLQR
jgi:hypothetical protein